LLICLAFTIAKGENLDDLLSEKSYGPQDAYAKSKLSNVLFTRELARRLKEQGNDKITAVSLHPGVVRTELFKYVPGAFLMKWFPPIQFLGWLIMKSPVEGAQTSLHCITAPSVDRSSGEYFSDCAVATSSAQGRDMELAKKLWDKSEKLVGL
jgi:NAD(P)-dependent dehydrogenase (short-subunit alcohol dehydrogenase family)